MAGRGGPSYLKRQKEQKRTARAIAKRAAQQARRERRAAEHEEPETQGEGIPAETNGQDALPDDSPTD